MRYKKVADFKGMKQVKKKSQRFSERGGNHSDGDLKQNLSFLFNIVSQEIPVEKILRGKFVVYKAGDCRLFYLQNYCLTYNFSLSPA